MSIEEIKAFLRKRQGYLKEGAGRLARKLNASKENCRVALREIREEKSNYVNGDFKRMFFDIETSPNIGFFWRPGSKISVGPENIIEERAVICVSWKWEDDDKVYNLRWDKDKDDKALLEAFVKELDKADEVIAHNGDSFDIKWLRTRCLYHKIPFNTYIRTLDTLRKVRSMFNFNSNKLDYIARFLGVGGKVETGGFDLWKNITLYNDKKSLDKMVYYCDNDVVILEDVYRAIESYIKPNTHAGVHKGKGKHTCPNCGNEHVHLLNNRVTPQGVLKRHMGCDECGTDYIISNTTYKKINS
jgi:DNA polymerase elongation subunit (family B)